MTKKVDLGFMIPATTSLSVVEQVLMVMREVDIGLRPSTLPPITQVGMVDFWVDLFILVLFMKLFMVMIEVDIGLRIATLLPITTVVNTPYSPQYNFPWGSGVEMIQNIHKRC